MSPAKSPNISGFFAAQSRRREPSISCPNWQKGRPFCYMFFLYRVRFLPRTHALPVRVSSIRPAYSSTTASPVLTPGFSGFAGR